MGDFVLNLLGTQSTREESMMDRTASAGFEGIAQMLLEQKKLMDALESENRELRRQLADLRRGIGIAVIIEGKTIQLANDAGSSNGQSQAALQGLQGMQNTPPPTMSQSSSNSYNNQNGRSTNSQPTVTEKRDNNVRSPLADSFVL